jgi:hypothetical protein
VIAGPIGLGNLVQRCWFQHHESVLLFYGDASGLDMASKLNQSLARTVKWFRMRFFDEAHICLTSSFETYNLRGQSKFGTGARLFTSLSFESRMGLFGSSKLFAGNKNSQFNVPQCLKAFISSLFDTNIRI